MPPNRAINHQLLFKRFSQLSGVPQKQLYPVQKIKPPSEYGPWFDAWYNKSTHEGHFPKGPNERIKQHEQRHALQNLSALSENTKSHRSIESLKRQKTIPRIFSRFFPLIWNKSAMHTKWNEPTNADPVKNKGVEAIRDMISNPLTQFKAIVTPTFVLFSPNVGLVLASTLGYQFMQQMRRQTNVRNVFRNHGEDGLLLLWAAPPRKRDALEVKKWEKNMVQNGYLLPNGGMTRKGLRYWREHVQPQAIWQFLAEAEKRRTSKT